MESIANAVHCMSNVKCHKPVLVHEQFLLISDGVLPLSSTGVMVAQTLDILSGSG